MVSRADLHVHSKYSDQPSEWLLRRVGAPESFTEPAEVYRLCRERGMGFVTISDHNVIDGAREIAHLPGTFLSSEVTVTFPEDGCRIHCLVLGVTEAQFAEIDRLRANVYELRDYLYDHDVIHSVAHPLFQVNGLLTVDHLEKLLLLFKRFEGINGARDPRAGNMARAVLQNLTPSMIERLVDRHGIDPRDDRPWIKHLTAGSDDHSGLYVACAYTETPQAATVEELLGHLRRGEHGIAGRAGSSLRLARSFYSISYRYLQERPAAGGDGSLDLFSELVGRLVEGDGQVSLGPGFKLRATAARFLQLGRSKVDSADLELARELAELASDSAGGAGTSVERRCFAMASRLSQHLAYTALRKAVDHLDAGRPLEAVKAVSPLGMAAMTAAPYFASFHTQHQDEALLQEVAQSFPASRPLRRKSDKKAWFSDNFNEVGGVGRMLRSVAGVARNRCLELELVSCSREAPEDGLAVTSFEPVGELDVPASDAAPLAFPPFLEILEHCERKRFAEIVVSTPGPLGLAAVAAARLLGLRLTGIYHTDFPLYVRNLTESLKLEDLTWSYMRWFFNQMDTLYVPSRAYLEMLAQRGFEPEHMRVLPLGVDRELFGPTRHDPGFWRRFGLGEGFKFLYVGRILKEKNLDALLSAFMALQGEGHRAHLAIVGDGPYLEELESRYRRPDILFTGVLRGEDLAAAYASADVFVFPSLTDTFGNAVLEAQASGLPAIVCDRGGPAEIVEHHGSGRAVDLRAPGELARAMTELLRNDRLRAEMAREALKTAREYRWETVVDELWSDDRTLDELGGLAAEADDRELARAAADA